MAPIVFVVDDDDAVRAAVLNLLAAEGYHARGFAAGADFFADDRPDTASCLICDMKMPELGALEVAAELARQGTDIPIIFMTGLGSIPMLVQAMKAGAVEFLTKPVAPEDLLLAARSLPDLVRYAERRRITKARSR